MGPRLWGTIGSKGERDSREITMTTIHRTFHKTFARGTRTATRPRRFLNNVLGGLLLPPLLFALGACDFADDLLSVELPGRVRAEDLNDPSFARTLMLSAQGDFECALTNHIFTMGLWTTEFHPTSARTRNIVSLRDLGVLTVSAFGSNSPQPTCREYNPPPLSTALHVARGQANTAIELLSGFDEAEVPQKDFYIGKTYTYRGYGVELLSEMACAVAFDSGPLETRDQGFERARSDFLEALGILGGVTSGPNVSEARSLENMAKIGYARASLQVGDAAGVLRYADDIPEGFVRYADRTATSDQTRNHVARATADFDNPVHELLHNLEVQGVPDPRVPVRDEGRTGNDQITPMWSQLKYTSESDDIPFATWREMRLMVAEVEGGQTAVDIINLLRAKVNDIPWLTGEFDLPEFSSTDEAEIRAQVIEERRRELWLQGTRIGDMLRNDIPFATGINPKGETYGGFTCVPIEEREEVNNPNL